MLGWQKRKGMSLISLVLGSALGAFLIIVIMQIFSATRSSYKLAQNLAEMDDVMRYASTTINDIVSQAGYRYTLTSALTLYSTAFNSQQSTTIQLGSGTAYSYTNTTSRPNANVPTG